MTGVANGFMASAPVQRSTLIGSKLATISPAVMTLGRRARTSAVLHRLDQSARLKAVPRSACFFFNISSSNHHHNTGLDGGSSWRDVSTHTATLKL
jgi:hypothetical protein